MKYELQIDSIKWRDIDGYEGFYQVSNTGLVRSIPKAYTGPKNSLRYTKGGILKGKENSTGYLRVHLYNKEHVGKDFFVHRLVANAFLPNPNNLPCVNHKNSIRKDNAQDNLEWCTNSENQIHAHEIGFQLIGGNKPASKLTANDVIKIKQMLITKKSYAKIAKIFNVSSQVIFQINNGLTWKWVLIN